MVNSDRLKEVEPIKEGFSEIMTLEEIAKYLPTQAGKITREGKISAENRIRKK